MRSLSQSQGVINEKVGRSRLNNRFFCSIISAQALATPIMPDYGSVPSGWTTDRYDPDSFSNVGAYQGRNDVLGIRIDDSDGLGSRPSGYNSTFYNTQGRQHSAVGGAGSVLSADLYVPGDWAHPSHGSRRTDMWGVMTDGTGVSDYAIIGFTNYEGAGGRLRVWDADTASGWVDLLTAVTYNDWMSLAIGFTGSAYEYVVNGSLAYTDSTIHGSTGFSNVIMQGYNFCGDSSLKHAKCSDYTAHWDNAKSVAEPATLALLGIGFLGLSGVNLRRPRSTAAVS